MLTQHSSLRRLSCLLLLMVTMFLPFNAAVAGSNSITRPVETSYLYTIQPNDTLWHIAARHGLSVAELLAANPGVNPRGLPVGGQLRIPGAAAGAPLAAEAPAPEQPASSETAPENAPEVATTPAAEIDPLALAMLNLINEKRVAGGRPALIWNDQLAAAAQAHAEDCARRNRGSHLGSDGTRLATRLQRVGYPASWSGENWANARSVEHAMAIWWNEPPGADPHVQNIMSSRATEIGIGVARGRWGIYFVANFGSR